MTWSLFTVQIMTFLSRSTLKLHAICQIWGSLSAMILMDRMYYYKKMYPWVLKCLLTFLRCMRKVRRFLTAYTSPSYVKLCDFCQGWLSNCKLHTKYHILGTLSTQEMRWMCNTRNISIGAKVFHILPLVYKVDERSFWNHLSANYGSLSLISAKFDSQIIHKMPDLG